MKKIMRLFLLAIAAAALLTGSSACTKVHSDEIGVRVLNVPYFHGVKPKPLSPGWAMDIPYVHTFYKIKITTKSLEMSEFGSVKYKVPGQPSGTAMEEQEKISAPAELNLEEKLDWVEEKLSWIDQRQYIVDHDRRRGLKSVWIKTSDGNDAWVDVTVQYKIVPDLAYLLVKNIKMSEGAKTIDADIDNLVESMVRSSIRFYLSALDTANIPITQNRTAQVDKAMQDLNQKLGIFGIEVTSLYTPRVKLHRDYEMMIELKQVVEEETVEFEVQKNTAKVMIKKNTSRAKGIADAMIEKANGRFESAKLNADADLAAKERQAAALGVHYNEMAAGIAAQTSALSVPGGDAHVGLAVSEAMQGKSIVIVPSNGSFNMMDINDLIQTYGAAKALKSDKEQKAGSISSPAINLQPDQSMSKALNKADVDSADKAAAEIEQETDKSMESLGSIK